MVQCQLSTLEHLQSSGFGRPPPRHGLQLLFWFAKHCVTLEFNNSLVSDCQPENGCYGFHLFGNIEELLPLAYYLVGNLNTETYPASANLPAYVTEYYRLSNNPDSVTTLYDNLDRIIISLRVGTRVVETVYVTEHDMFVSGRFSPDNTHEVSPALIRALQSPELDLSTFLTHMGYYQGMQVARNPSAIAQWFFGTVFQGLPCSCSLMFPLYISISVFFFFITRVERFSTQYTSISTFCTSFRSRHFDRCPHIDCLPA
uniref:Uncharacterized protein n=1 Tax=Myripristis murdjan TaxID=586833 RepID=A0A667WM12_9TELE